MKLNTSHSISTNILPGPVKSGWKAHGVAGYQLRSKLGRTFHPVLIWFCPDRFSFFSLSLLANLLLPLGWAVASLYDLGSSGRDNSAMFRMSGFE